MRMKGIITMLLALALVLTIIGMASAALNDGLVAYYPFNGNANDESGNGNNGTVYEATLTVDRCGQANSAYSFNGMSSYIQVPYTASFDVTTSGFAVAGWFKANSSQLDSTGVYDLVDKSHSRSGSSDYAGWVVQTYVGCDIQFAVGTGWSWPQVCSDTAAFDDIWHHFAATFQGSTMSIYIDGTLRNTTDFPGDTPVSNTRDLFIGRHYVFGRYFTGNIDEIRIYKRNLSPDEVSELAEVQCYKEVSIDIKPGSFTNSINPKSKGKIPVAILTTETFNATTVNTTTVLFGATGTEATPVQSALEDVDADGDSDMILHFNAQNTGIKCGDISASLTGETFDGQAIKGSDSIKTVGCK